MPTEIVVDSSVITALVTPEEHSDWVFEKLSEHDYFHILDLNFYEVANAIKHKISETYTTKDATDSFKKSVELMNLYAVHNFSEIIIDAITIAFEFDITVYDTAFLTLADKLDMRLLTLDVKLANKLEHTKYFGLIECPN